MVQDRRLRNCERPYRRHCFHATRRVFPIDPHDVGTQLRHHSRRGYSADTAVITYQRVGLALVRIPNRLSGAVGLCQGWSSVCCHSLGGYLQILCALKFHLHFFLIVKG